MSNTATLPQQLHLPAARQRTRLVMLVLALLPFVVAPFARAEEVVIRGPDVTIIAAEERTIYEYRQGGELRMIKIVPTIGKPYFLVPRDRTTGFGNLERADMLLPSWVIFEF